MSTAVTYHPGRDERPHAQVHMGHTFPSLELGPVGAPVIGFAATPKDEAVAYLRALAESASWLADRLEGHHRVDDERVGRESA